MATSISRKYTTKDFGGKPKIDDKNAIFEDRILGWQIEIAEELKRQIDDKEKHGTTIQHAGFALLGIQFTYFEMIAQYQAGKSSDGKSKKFFGKGLESVYPKQFSPAERDEIYVKIRCGMYHTGFTKKGALIDGDYKKAIQIQGGTVQVNPHMLVTDIKQHFA